MKLNPIFRDSMVFAAGKPIRIYGEGAGDGRITFAGQSKEIKNEGARWMAEFSPMEEGGPYTLEAELAGEKTVFTDIFIGKIYLFAGQSNMQFKMKESSAPQEFYEDLPALRLFSTERIAKGLMKFHS